MKLTEKDGEYLLNLAKNAIETYLDTNEIINPPKDCPDYLKEKLGAFVTLNKHNQLRGCIGYSEPICPLVKAVINVGISAATEDPRFKKVSKEEFKDIDLEITVLTKPELIKVENSEDYLDEITLGEDGIIVEQGFNKGLLLPQVPLEHNMGKREFLSNTCMKAGLHPNTWINETVKIYKFQGIIFKEKTSFKLP